MDYETILIPALESKFKLYKRIRLLYHLGNDYTGFECEPSIQLAWTPTEKQTIWASVSRAVRTPSWSDLATHVNWEVSPQASSPVLLSSAGGRDLNVEELLAYELGYRAELTHAFSVDVTGFYNDYSQLIAPMGVTTGFGSAPVQNTLVASTYENTGGANSYGVELSARWDVTERWHLIANYSWLDMHLDFSSPSLQSGPQHQAQLRSSLDLPYHLELNGVLSYVGEEQAHYGLAQTTIPDYFRLDVGVIWHATKNLEIGVWGQNLASDRHLEYVSYKTVLLTEIPRSVVGRITWRF